MEEYIVLLEGVFGSGLDPLGNAGNCTDPRVQVLQVGGCIQDLWNERKQLIAMMKHLVVVSHPNDEVYELLEVELCPGESISHKELPIVPIEVSLQPDQYWS